MEMNGGSTALYLARTLCVPVFLLILVGLEAKELLDFQGRRGITSILRWNLHPVLFCVGEWVTIDPPLASSGWEVVRGRDQKSVKKSAFSPNEGKAFSE